MTFSRGDNAPARFPHTAGGRGKKRPALIVQADAYNRAVPHVVVAEITSNMTRAGDPASLSIDMTTPEGQATGLSRDSLVSFLHLATINADRIDAKIGSLAGTLVQKMNDGLKAALDIP
jgi:mRNA-degrading endonuclease toxin of MazEF toxin-antitoxin module